MALTPSTMLPLGTTAPDFQLPDTDGKIVSSPTSRTLRAAGGFHLQPLSVCHPHPRAACATWPTITRSAERWRCRHQLQRREKFSRRQPGQNEGRSESRRLHFPVSLRREPGGRQKLSRRLHAGYFSCSTAAAASFIAASSTPAGRATAFPSPAKICAPHWTPCLPENPPRNSRRPASAAISSGKRATSRIIFNHGLTQITTDSKTVSSFCPIRVHPCASVLNYFFGSFSSTISHRT